MYTFPYMFLATNDNQNIFEAAYISKNYYYKNSDACLLYINNTIAVTIFNICLITYLDL